MRYDNKKRSKIASADNDERYVKNMTRGNTLSVLAHESRYNWLANNWICGYEKILDFGCGSGFGTNLYANHTDNKVFGIDYSETAIDFNNNEYNSNNLSFQQLDACASDIDLIIKDKFDLIVSFDVIEHVEKYFQYLKNTIKLLNCSGKLVVGCPNRLQTFKWNRGWKQFHMQEFTPYQLREILLMYYNDVEMYSQDFIDKNKRERVRLERINISVIKKIYNRLIPARISNIIPLFQRIYNNKEQLYISDIEFLLEPEESVLNNAFGIIAVCKNPIIDI